MTREEALAEARRLYGPNARVEEFVISEARDAVPGQSAYWVGIGEDELGYSTLDWESCLADAARRAKADRS